MAKSKLSVVADLAPATETERARVWAEKTITPEIRSAGIETADAQSMMQGKVQRFADLLHARGVLSCHVHLSRNEKKTAVGDTLPKLQAIKEQLDSIFDASLSPTRMALVLNNQAERTKWNDSKSKLRQRIAGDMTALEKVEATLNGDEVGEGDGDGDGKPTKTDYQKGVERLQSALKAFQKVEPDTVSLNVHEFCEGLEKLIAHAMTHGTK